tara:strand:- start:112 stop:636 length:525 start_codon:yes stop_codon:yes gene_type:complete
MAVTNIFTNNIRTRVVRSDPSNAGRSTCSFVPGDSAYSAGDVLGFCEFPNAAQIAGGSGRITEVVALDSGNLVGSDAFNVFLFSATPATTFTENAAFAPTFLDFTTLLSMVQCTDSDDITVHNTIQIWQKQFVQPVPYVCASDSTSIFAVVELVGAHTFGATDIVQISLGLELD